MSDPDVPPFFVENFNNARQDNIGVFAEFLTELNENWFLEIGVRYQMYHAFALLAVAWAFTKWPGKVLVASGWLFIIGTVLFSGTLYMLSLSGLKWLGMIAPIGGLTLMTAWLCLAWSVWKK